MKNLIVFTIGAVVYPLLEILWRGFSHWSMEIVGGLCFLSIYVFEEKKSGASLIMRCTVGAAIITAMEFSTGLLVNRLLNWNVWSYENLPLNLMGQICLPYSLLWLAITVPIIFLCRILRIAFFRLENL